MKRSLGSHETTTKDLIYVSLESQKGGKGQLEKKYDKRHKPTDLRSLLNPKLDKPKESYAKSQDD